MKAEMLSEKILIRPFQPPDQAACKALVLAGLEEHWGWLDPTLNPDLNDIQASFQDGLFLTAWQDEELIGTGGLLRADPGCFQVVRMSVARKLRGHGLGRRILARLEAHARSAGAKQLVLETTETWVEVVRFYQGCGYRVTHRLDGDIYFEKELSSV